VEIVCAIDGFDKDSLDTDDDMTFRIVFVETTERRRRNLGAFFAPTDFADSP